MVQLKKKTRKTTKVQHKYGYEEIGIEQCNDNAKAFARKLNFKAIDERNENFVISIEDLRQALS